MPVQLTVLDVSGRVGYTANGVAENVFTFGQHFRPGMYLVEVRQGNEVKTVMAIKIK